jgi:16S rRNA (uracil1498-N3)-methyltransferase
VSAARRLFAAALPEDGGAVELGPEAARHARVLRLGPDDPVVLFDGRGHEAEATVEAVAEDGLRCRAAPRRPVAVRRPRVVLVLAMPKGGKLDGVVRACTELGVAAVHLFHAERSVARPEPARAAKRLARLAKVAREAARQSQRADLPELREPAGLAEVVARAPEEAAKLAFVVGAERSLASVEGEAEEAWIVVGPEGGLSPAEVRALEARGFDAVGLGPGVLRVETAATVAVALVTHRLGGLRPLAP